MMFPCRSLLFLTAISIVGPALICPVFSQAAEVDQAAVNAMIELNKKAFTDIQAKKFDPAKKALLKAIGVGKEAGLEAHEMMARTYVHLAAICLTGANARDKAVNQFMMALKINPNITMTVALDTPALKSAYLLARKQLGLPPQPDFDPPLAEPEPNILPVPDIAGPAPSLVLDRAEPDPPATVQSPLYCPLPFEIPPKEDRIIRCLTQMAPGKSTATVYYRTEGSATDDFTEVAMLRSPKGWLTATIPANAVVGKTLPYYIEAQLPGATEKISLGKLEAPNSFSIREDTVVDQTDDDDDDEDPLRTISVSNADDEDTRVFHRRLPGALVLGVSVGAGAGYHGREYVDSGARDASDLASGKSFDQSRKVLAPSGFSPARLTHVEVELGYQLTKKLWISAFGRYQYAPRDGRGGQAVGEQPVLTKAMAGFVRANYAFATLGNFQAYASAGVGAGRSFLLTFSKGCDEAKADNGCVLAHSDTISRHGFAATASLGAIYHLSRWFAVFIDLKEIATLPKFMALSEANLGVAFAYDLRGDSDKASPEEVEQRGSEPAMGGEPATPANE